MNKEWDLMDIFLKRFEPVLMFYLMSDKPKKDILQNVYLSLYGILYIMNKTKLIDVPIIFCEHNQLNFVLGTIPCQVIIDDFLTFQYIIGCVTYHIRIQLKGEK